MRKLASIRIVNKIQPIPGADAIELAGVDGWEFVVKKGEFQVGDKGVYFEIDSFLNANDPRFHFLSKQFIEFDGNKGARIRTIRLRGQRSQGLLLPLSKFPELVNFEIGQDATEILGVMKWEPPVPAQLAGDAIGLFPHYIFRTEAERIQNLVSEIQQNQGQVFEKSIKLDGSSMTVFRNDQASDKLGNTFTALGVCSRNLNLRENDTNTYWRVARKEKIIEALEFLGRNLAFQGELIGEGIQGNHENIKGHTFYIFNIFDIDKQQYLTPVERTNLVQHLVDNGFPLKQVPILGYFTLQHSVQEILDMADGESLNASNREGLVFKRIDGQFSFKAISNWYIEKFQNR